MSASPSKVHDCARLHAGEPREGEGVYGLAYGARESLVHLVPAPFEATVSYGSGTAEGPRAILAASGQVDLLDLDYGRPYRAGIFLQAAPEGLEEQGARARAAVAALSKERTWGDQDARRRLHAVVEDACERMNAKIEGVVRHHLERGRIVGLVGGDHSVAWPAIRAHARAFGEVGVLQFDAHMDLRRAYQDFTWSHASVMHNVVRLIPEVTRLVQVGVRDFCDEELSQVRSSGGRIVAWTDNDLREPVHAGRSFAEVARAVVADLPRSVYVSFDIDGLDPRLCPHTGTPVPGGLSFHEAAEILRALSFSGRRMVGFDLCEVAPGKDSQWDGNVGARVLYKLIGATLASRVTSLAVGTGDGSGVLAIPRREAPSLPWGSRARPRSAGAARD